MYNCTLLVALWITCQYACMEKVTRAIMGMAMHEFDKIQLYHSPSMQVHLPVFMYVRYSSHDVFDGYNRQEGVL